MKIFTLIVAAVLLAIAFLFLEGTPAIIVGMGGVALGLTSFLTSKKAAEPVREIEKDTFNVFGADRTQPYRQVVGLTGGLQTGKDTAAALLGEYGFERVAFADKVRELALKCNPSIFVDKSYDGEEFRDLIVFRASPYVPLVELVNEFGWDRAKTGVAGVRKFLQDLGAGAREVIGPDVWIDATHPKVQEILDRGGKVVLSDERYDNEAEYTHDDLNGVVFRLNRDEAPTGDDHESEKGISDHLIDAEIDNNGGKRELLFNLLEALRYWGYDVPDTPATEIEG